MNKTHLLLILALPAAAAWKAAPAGESAPGPAAPPAQTPARGDFVPFPPARAEAASPGGRYVLTVESRDGWKTKHALARLARRTAAGLEAVWEKTLPQEYGPRYALVGEDGRAVFFDESINVASRFAVMVVGPDGRVEASHGFEAVAGLLGVKTSALVEQAKGGSWWISAPPALDGQGKAALVEAGGRRVRVDLGTGRLSLAD